MEVYEVLEDIRCLRKETLAFGNSMKSWMSNEEIEDFNKLKYTFNNMISYYEGRCIDENICPSCGGEIISKEINDKDCGSYVVPKCIDCQKSFD